MQIYEVCEEHGRIAYRRADGSRLITSNDHWKSQVRHALYTGGRFERVPSNGEYWQLSPAFRGSAAELVKVLVRADDKTQHIKATLALTPSTGRTILPKLTAEPIQAVTARQRRKRTGTAVGEGSVEAMCDSVDPMGSGPMKAPALRPRARMGDGSAPDNHSTQDEAFDEVRDLPRLRARRMHRRPTWKASDDGPGPGPAPPPVKMDEDMRSYGERAANAGSRDSADPSSLRWGSTGLRSTIIISAADSSGLSAGRTPLLPRPIGRMRDTSAEADSAPKHRWTIVGHGGETAQVAGPPPPKRQATLPPAARTMPTPPAMAEGPAQVTPPFMTQWAEAMQHQMEEAAMAHQKSMAAAGPSGNAWPGNGAGSFPPGFPPMAMLPAMLPGLLAAAAPFFSSHHAQQQLQQQLQQQMQAVMLGTGAAGQLAQQQQPMPMQIQQQQQAPGPEGPAAAGAEINN